MPTPSPSPFWVDWTSAELAEADLSGHTVVLPLGATEQHGPHLPLDVDTAIVQAVVARAVARADHPAGVLYLPPLALGHSLEHRDFAGTLSLDITTALAVCRDVGDGLARAGVRRFVFLNGHGGNVSLMDLAGRRLRADHGFVVHSVNWFSLGLPDGTIPADELRFGVHGGRLETSVMLAIRPDGVRTARLRHFDSLRRDQSQQFDLLADGQSCRYSWMAQDLNPAGAAGDAASASADEGRRILDHVCARWNRLLAEIARVPADVAAGAPSRPSRPSPPSLPSRGSVP